ncbi:MAG: hypothetical protein IJ747_04695 [Lachnospiraceae bacterium]|nr:hypothetical protein [Lachnospiraceae bacterium]
MNDTYVECLVQAKRSGKARALTVGLIVLTVLLALAMFAIPATLLLAVLTGVGAYFANLYSHVEYEYLYLDREITVDKIMAQSGRKRVATYSLDRLEVFAPIKSWHLDAFRNRDVKTVDYSIGEELQPDERYVMYYEGGARVLFSPSQEFVAALKNVAPRKVFSD